MLKPEKLLNLALILLTTLVLLLTGILITGVSDDYRSREQMEKISAYVDRLTRLGENLAMERGLTAASMAMAKNGITLYANEIPPLRSQINLEWSEIYREISSRWNELPADEGLPWTLKNASEAHARLETVRLHVQNCLRPDTPCELEEHQWLSSTTEFIEMLSQVREELVMAAEAQHKIIYFSITAKRWAAVAAEHAGRERGLLAYQIGTGKPLSQKQLNELTQYRAIVDRSTKQLLHHAQRPCTEPSITAAIKRMNRIFLQEFETFRQDIYQQSSSGQYQVDVNTWIKKSTQAIESIIAISNVLTKSAIERNHQLEKKQIVWLILQLILATLALILGTLGLTWLRGVVREIFTQKGLAETTLASIGDAVITTDNTNRITYINPMAEQLTGWKAKEAKNMPSAAVFKIIDTETRESTPDPVEACLNQQTIQQSAKPALLIHKNLTECMIESLAAPILDPNAKPLGAVLVFYDTAAMRHASRLLSFQAAHDLLTGLFNRREFERVLQEMLVSAHLEQREHALVYMDLDQFKLLNDTCGHNVGDRVLSQIAQIIKEPIKDSCLLARIGGDEFGLLIPDTDIDTAVEIAKQICNAVATFQFSLNEHRFDIGISIGIVPVNKDSTHIADLLGHADAACFAAKEKGRNRVQLYQPGDQELIERQQQMAWISRINQALEEDRLVLYCQKIAPCNPNHLWHSEILIRMRDTSGRLISPGEFIPAAERYGLMPKIDRWVLANAFKTIGSSLQENAQELIYNINLSGASLSDEYLHEFILELSETYQVPASAICLEITETTAIENMALATRFMHYLRDYGFSFALDDFGSGLSSFGYLKHLPLDYLKIDGALVKDVVRDQVNRVMVEAIARIGRAIGLKTVAEFVENQKIWDFVCEAGIDFAQGYAVHKPQPLDKSAML